LSIRLPYLSVVWLRPVSNSPTREKMLEVAKTYAKNALTAREMTADQLRTRAAAKLARRFSSPDCELDPDIVASVVAEVVALCSSYSLIDDAAYVRRRASAAVRSGKSKRMSGMALQAKGIDAETARDGLDGFDDLAAALNFLRKKKSGPYAADEEDEVRRQKVMGAFLRAGFSYSLWNKARAMELDEVEEYLAEASASLY
jgi:regulatory protein